MEKYIGTKIVEAEMDRLTENRYGYEAGAVGYKVRYEDGYESWCPAYAFMKAYHRLEGLPFGQAIEGIKAGFKAQRAGWNGKNQYIELAKNISYINADGEEINVGHDAIGNKAIAFVGTSGVQLGWLASQADMLAEDWKIVES